MKSSNAQSPRLDDNQAGPKNQGQQIQDGNFSDQPQVVAYGLNDGAKVFRADCRLVIPAPGSVAHVITDPPCENHLHNAKRPGVSKRQLRTDGRAAPASLTFPSIDGIREAVTAPLIDICQGWFIAFCTPEGVATGAAVEVWQKRLAAAAHA